MLTLFFATSVQNSIYNALSRLKRNELLIISVIKDYFITALKEHTNAKKNLAELVQLEQQVKQNKDNQK